MADANAGQYLEMKIYTYLDNQLGINVHYGRIDEIVGGGIGGDLLAIVISEWFSDAIKALISTPAKYLGMSIRQYDVGGPKWATLWTKQDAGFGNGGAVPCPKQAAGILSKETAIGGVAGRGRTYIPFPSTDFVEADGNPTNAYLTAATTYANKIDGSENVDLTNELVITFGLMKWRDAASFKRTTKVTPRDRFATQMRRGDYGRLNAIPPQLV